MVDCEGKTTYQLLWRYKIQGSAKTEKETKFGSFTIILIRNNKAGQHDDHTLFMHVWHTGEHIIAQGNNWPAPVAILWRVLSSSNAEAVGNTWHPPTTSHFSFEAHSSSPSAISTFLPSLSASSSEQALKKSHNLIFTIRDHIFNGSSEMVTLWEDVWRDQTRVNTHQYLRSYDNFIKKNCCTKECLMQYTQVWHDDPLPALTLWWREEMGVVSLSQATWI